MFISPQKSPKFPQKSPVSLQKTPVSPQKSPTYLSFTCQVVSVGGRTSSYTYIHTHTQSCTRTHSRQRALYLHKKALYRRERAPFHVGLISRGACFMWHFFAAKEPTIPCHVGLKSCVSLAEYVIGESIEVVWSSCTKEPYISTKEPYISANEPYIFTQKTSIAAKEPYVPVMCV